jgi:hypothetical protein
MHAAILETDAAVSTAAGQHTRTDAAARALVALAARAHMDGFLAAGIARL